VAHILLINSGLTGILNASFEVINRLEKAGHRVTFASPEKVGEKVIRQGFEYVQLPPMNFFPEPELPNYQGRFRKLKRLWYKWLHVKQRRKAAVEALGMDIFAEKVREISPDLILIDVELHEHLMTAISMKIPTILLSQWFSLWKRKGLPPLLHETIPGKGFRGSWLGLEWAWSKIKVNRWRIFWKKKLRSGGTNRRSILKKYARTIGFSLKYASENYWPGPLTYNTLPVLNMTLEEMEFPHSIRPNSHYIGAMVFEKRKDIQIDISTEKRLNEIFETKQKTGAKLIYCSVSTFRKGDSKFLKKLTEAVKNREDWILIIGLGGKLNTDFLEPMPKNVHAFEWIPQLKVLAQADCSINHGGIHTINECIHFRVPMLVYSGKRSDQNGCAARVAYHNLGIMADKDKDGVAEIRGNIESILESEVYQTNIDRMYECYRRYEKEAVLEKFIEGFLKE
jgi:UDP:flavonoid glycosyltransferase YjiC (YdhE family)